MFALSVATIAFSPTTPTMHRVVAPVAPARMVAPVNTPSEIESDSGATSPLGYFDPLGLAKAGPLLQPTTVDQYNYYKEVEIKHSRLAMLAALGFVVAELWHPLFGGYVNAPSAFAFQQTPLQIFWPSVITAIGFFELSTSVPAFEDPAEKSWTMKPDHIPGDLGFFGGRNLALRDPEAFNRVQTKEINNGRLAMIGIAGMVAQELVSGSKLF